LLRASGSPYYLVLSLALMETAMTRIATSCLALGLGFLALIGQAGQLPPEPAAPVVKAPLLVNVASPHNGVVVKICVDEGDTLVPGTVLVQLDDRLARIDRDIKQARLYALGSQYEAMVKSRDWERKHGRNDRRNLTEEELRREVLDWERHITAAYAEKEVIHVAELELKQAEMLVEMHQIKSPVGGVVKAILRQPGEGLKYLETIVQIEPSQE
jgi:multidrug efflux pump subunit AcrA (membrane-fusion protein)